MANLFYLIGLILFLCNFALLTKFFKFEKIREWSVKFQKVTNRGILPSDFKENEYNELKAYTAILVFNFMWIFFGLISKDWKVCGSLLLFNFASNYLSKKIGEFKGISKILRFSKFSITTILIGLMTINHFDLHWDLWKVITHLH
jgi:hypothetical protein